ncbi:T9SS type A sorting domain-containing protein [Chryseobacterium foetidum]|uniref:T9SS type A sorting domain-containing protein n=1 Tax=Chryseobacterium foetidum TaxID=2951057 RepID=UPI0021C6575B|nr:T9SS type A sorting domain-containing protein [Chryseobacterium foetidum]
MKKIITLFILIITNITVLRAQTYQWQWAKTGGAFNGINSVGFDQKFDEQILDIAVDNQNNTYYLSSLFNTTPLLDGQPVTNYGGRNLIIFSTDCQGNVRWTRTIGGSGNTGGQAHKIVLDNNGGLYVSAFMPNNATPGSGNLPPRFGDSDIQPMISNNFSEPQAALKTGFLLKYNTDDGQLAWRKAFQDDVSLFNSYIDVGTPLIDSQGIIHIIVGFSNGSHLGGLITVPSTYNTNNNFQYFLIKYNALGNIVGTPSLLPIQGFTNFSSGYLNFIYDEVNSRYYLGGTSPINTGSTAAFSYNNIGINESAFVLAFNSTTFAELWRKEIDNGFAQPSDNIFGLKKDPVTSDIYVSGLYSEGAPTPATFGSYTFSTPLSGRISFVAKLNISGTVLWCTNPVALSDGSTQVAVENARMPITIKGNEVLFAKGSIRETWGNFPMVRPVNERTDPLVVKFNKDTGAITGTHEVLGSSGAEDHFTAIATDNDGNIMLGGFINGQLFVDPNDGVPTISNASGSQKSNFFFAKLANTACSALSTAETKIEDSQISFYPNPTQDFVLVSTKNALQNYAIYSTAGQLVKQGKFENNDNKIQMQGLSTGHYIIKITTVKGNLTGKVMKR